MEETERKKARLSIFLIAILIICLLIIATLTYYIYIITQENTKLTSDIEEINTKLSQNLEQNEQDNIVEESKDGTILLTHFDSNKGKNIYENNTYSIRNSSYESEIAVIQVNEDNEVKISLDYFANSYYKEKSKRTNTAETIGGFSKKVKEVEMGIIGNGSSRIITFIMEDGTVEYISLTDALQTDNLKSRGQLQGLKNIVRIENANCGYFGGGGGLSLIAIDKDGYFYDIAKIIEENNIDLEKVN